MLKRLTRYLRKQRLIPWVGEFKETLAQAMFWLTIINGGMIAATFYFTTLRHIAPWFRLPLFVAVAIVLIGVIFVVEFKFIVPSIWAFRGKQMDLRNAASPKEGENTAARRIHDERRDSHIAHVPRGRSRRKGYRRY